MPAISRRNAIALLTAVIALAGVGVMLNDGARAGAPLAVNADAEGLALYGFDPVAYMTDGKPTLGDPAINAVYEGAAYHFASAAHRDAFLAEPAKYLPAYGGYCAYGVSKGYKVKIDPEAWSVVDGKLYLNYDMSVRETWQKDTAGYIGKAESNWPRLKDGPRAD